MTLTHRISHEHEFRIRRYNCGRDVSHGIEAADHRSNKSPGWALVRPVRDVPFQGHREQSRNHPTRFLPWPRFSIGSLNAPSDARNSFIRSNKAFAPTTRP